MNINIYRKAFATVCLMPTFFLPAHALAQSNAQAQACALKHELKSEYSNRVGDLTFTNTSSDYVQILRVDPDGSSMEMTSLEAGKTSKLTQNRNAVYVGLDSKGKCMGAIKLRESRGNVTFGD